MQCMQIVFFSWHLYRRQRLYAFWPRPLTSRLSGVREEAEASRAAFEQKLAVLESRRLTSER